MKIQKIIDDIDALIKEIRDTSENEDGTGYNEVFESNANRCIEMLLKMQHHLESARMMACDIAVTLQEVLKEINSRPIWGKEIDDGD